MAGVLDGIRVIDFGQYIAGPLAAMLLADQGAEVIRIDPPGGPRWDTPANATWNRGKRSLVLDLRSDDGRTTARRLIESADIVIENFRPGVMTRLGLGAKAMTRANPQLIYCSLPGFASDDPRAEMAAWEGVVGAATATYRPRPGSPDGQPVYTAIPIASGYAAFVGVTSIAMALVARERDGVGQRIEVPMFDAMFTAVGLYGLRVHGAPPAPATPPVMPWVRQYECGDGRWVQFHAANTRFIRRFLEAAGKSDWLDEGVANARPGSGDPDLARDVLERMIALFKTRTAQEWEDLVNAAGTPTAICRSSDEWLDHPHARGAQMIVPIDDPRYGPMLQPGVQVRMSATPGAIRGPAPRLDADREDVFAELAGRSQSVASANGGPSTGRSNGGEPAARASGAPRAALDGLKVIDLCIILAGPTCGRTLAEFGADVIKIDDPHREGGIAFHNDVNRGKRSLLLDLKQPAGLEVFWRLVEDADVVVQNYRDGVVQRLGIEYEHLKARKPGIVYASLNAYGHVGPWAGRPGWEQLAQATTGMQARYGGDGMPVLQPYAINDYGTGLMGGFGVALALYHKRRTGRGQHIQTALAYTACTLQSAFMQRYEGKVWDEPRGQDAIGSGPLHRLYRARDGWFFLGAQETDLARLADVEGLAGIETLSGQELATVLEGRFAGAKATDWIARLTAAGAGAHHVAAVGEIMSDPWVQAHGLSLTREHAGAGLITTNGPAPRLSRTPVRPGNPASAPGADARDVLREAGLVDDFRELTEQGIVVTEGVPAR
jgi:crotonobetainyl-CoA:carnitine CoA-transferase CaiB-like acyl-CoA transferase